MKGTKGQGFDTLTDLISLKSIMNLQLRIGKALI